MISTLEGVQEKLQRFDIEWANPEESRLDASLACDVLLDVVQILKEMNVFYLAAMTGLDTGTDENSMEVLYHFCDRHYVVTLRAKLEKTQPELASICSVFPYASPLERETGEMFGINFINAPDTSRLFLPDDWDEGVYPLRKDANFGEVDDVNSK